MKKVVLVLFATMISLFAKEVTVSIVPQKYFVEQIAKDKIKVNVMVKPGFSPATYEPKTSQMRKLAKSDVYFSIGVPFEKVWLDRFKSANKNLQIVDTTKGIKKIAMAKHSHGDEEHHEHEAHHEDEHEKHHEHEAHHEDEHEEHHEHEAHHEDEHEEHHDHSGLDPHVWLDPVLVKIQAKNIYNTLVQIDGKNAKFYKANYEEFIKELDLLYIQIKKVLAPYHDKPFMVFHPSWGYFAKRFHLEQIAVEVQGKEPKPNQLIKLIDEAKEHKIKVVFVAPQFSQKSAKTIAKSIKGNVAVINPLTAKWSEGLLNTAKEVAKSYK